MDIALAIEHILYAAQYNGSVTANTQEAWDLVVWGENLKVDENNEPILDEEGNPISIPKPTWAELEKAWKELSTPKIENVKADKLAEIMTKCNGSFADIDSIYPSTEREGWYAQEAEAVAVLANSDAITPILTELVKYRNKGETVLDLANKVVNNATIWRAVYSKVIGQQQRMYAEVSRLDTVEAIQAYEVTYTL